MNDIQVTSGGAQPQARTLQVITGEIRLIHKQTQQVVLSAAIEIGRRLVEAKAVVPHGSWGEYLKNEVEYSQSTAQNFIRIFEGMGASQQSLFGAEAKSQTFGNLTYTKALELLVLPEKEREEFAAEHDLESMSTRELREAIRQREQAEAEKEAALEGSRKMAEDMRLANERLSELSERLEEKARAEQELASQTEAERTRLEELEEARTRLEQELEELRARPIEVVGASVPDEAALAAARKEGELSLKQKLDKAKKERDAAKDVVAQLEQEKQKAEEAARQAQEQHRVALETADQERKSMEKRIEMAGNREMTAFQHYFEVVQSDFLHLLEAFDKLSASGELEHCEKLAAAIGALLESLATQMEERKKEGEG